MSEKSSIQTKRNRKQYCTGKLIKSQGPEEMCLSLEHQNPSKTSEKMGYFDRVTVSLHILSLRATCCAPARIWLAVIDLGQIRSEEIIYSRFIKIPLGYLILLSDRYRHFSR